MAASVEFQLYPNGADTLPPVYAALLERSGFTEINGEMVSITEAGLPQRVDPYPWTNREVPVDPYHSPLDDNDLSRLAYGLRTLDDPQPRTGRHRAPEETTTPWSWFHPPRRTELDTGPPYAPESTTTAVGRVAVVNADPITRWHAMGSDGQDRAIQKLIEREGALPTAARPHVQPRSTPRPAPGPEAGRAAVPALSPAPEHPTEPGRKSDPTFVPDANDSKLVARMRKFYTEEHTSDEPDRYRGKRRMSGERRGFAKFMARGLGAVALGGGTALAALYTYLQIRGR